MMNQGNIGTNHMAMSGSSTSSKTVAAILKQAKEQQASEALRAQQQQTHPTKKKSRSRAEQNQQSSSILSQLNLSKPSPQNHVASPSVIASPALSPSHRGMSPMGKDPAHPVTKKSSSLVSPLGKDHTHAVTTKSSSLVSPLGKDHVHPVTTKSSSLSQEISPSLITAQIVKVMAAETTTTSAAPNLLRSALQGNIPDPMGILSSSKTEGGYVTVVTSLSGAVPDYSPAVRKSPANMSSLSPGSSNSGSLHQSHTFSKILTSITGAGGYLGQAEVDPIDSLMTTSTVENLLASSDGVIQTVNLSHIPKPVIPNGPSLSVLPGAAASAPAPSSRSSQRIAMEVAQQIKIEANGQKSSAQLAALRPGMQQQLRSQIQSSRSIDAQFTPKPVSVAGPQPGQRASPKETEHKSLEATLPLLASKLSPAVPFTMSKPAATTSSSSSSSSSHNRQQQQTTGDCPVYQLIAAISAAPSSSVTPTSTSARKSPHASSATKSVTELQQNMRHSQQPQLLSFQGKLPSDSADPIDHTVLLPQTLQSPADLNFSIVNQFELLTDSDKNQPTDKLFLPSGLRVSMADRSGLVSVKTDSKTSAVAKQQTHQNMSKSSPSSQVYSVKAMLAKIGHLTDKAALPDGGKNVHGLKGAGAAAMSTIPAHAAVAAAHYKPGETKQTAIDVDIELGQLAALKADVPTVQIEPSLSALLSSNLFHDSSIAGLHVSNLGMDSALGIVHNSNIPNSCGSASTFNTTPSISDNVLSSRHKGSTFSKAHLSAMALKLNSHHTVLEPHFLNSKVSDAPLTAERTSINKSKELQDFLSVSASVFSSAFTVPSLSSSSSSSSLSLPVTAALAYIPKPIVHACLSSSSSAAAVPLKPPPDYIPPPPYPVKGTQQYQPKSTPITLPQQSQGRVSQAVKHAVQNPFTFPTSGLKVDPDSSQLSYSSLITQNDSSSHFGHHAIKHELFQHMGDPKEEMTFLKESFFDVSVSSSLGKEARQAAMSEIPQLPFNGADVKTEVNEEQNDHKEITSHKEKRPLVQPFNQRVTNLSCFPVTNSTYRAAYRSHAVAVQRARSGVITNMAKSLDILRQNLQRNINKEITDIIKKYIDKYFHPALENIKQNNNENMIEEDQINYVCRQILEEVKVEYVSDSGQRSVTPSDIPDNVSETGSMGGKRLFLKRSRVSDSDSEKGSDGGFKRKFPKKKGRPPFQGSGRVTPSKTYKTGDPVKREGPKWDPERLKTETLFVMGARANKALGLGNTRGRLYIRHPDVFKYIGDQEDKAWLCEHNLMPATGGKAYMMLLEDIEDLSRSDEYKDSHALLMHECVGFTVPEWMLVKIKEQMNALRSDSAKRSQSRSPASELGELATTKVLPFSSFTDSSLKVEPMISPGDPDEMDFLSTADNDEVRPSSVISPFTVTGGYDDAVSPSPSDLDPIEDPPPVSHLFT